MAGIAATTASTVNRCKGRTRVLGLRPMATATVTVTTTGDVVEGDIERTTESVVDEMYWSATVGTAGQDCLRRRLASRRLPTP